MHFDASFLETNNHIVVEIQLKNQSCSMIASDFTTTLIFNSCSVSTYASLCNLYDFFNEANSVLNGAICYGTIAAKELPDNRLQAKCLSLIYPQNS